MEKYSDTVEAIKNLQPVKVPDDLVDQVMARVEMMNQIDGISINYFSARPQRVNPKAFNIFAERITSHSQCALLLFMVGFFYLVAGVVALWGFHDIMTENVNSWIKIQPYITIVNALFLVSSAFLILYRPQTTTFVQYALIIHVTLILANAYILQSIITFQFALVSVLIITLLAIIFAVLLIGAIQSVLKCGTI